MDSVFAKLKENAGVVVPTAHRKLLEMYLDPMELSAVKEDHLISV